MFQVQYYFPAKEQMLRYAWHRITELSGERAGRDIAEALQTGDERAVIRACLLAGQLEQAQQRGGVPAHFDTRLEADALATMTGGLLSAMLVEAYDAEQATRIIDYRLGHLFAG